MLPCTGVIAVLFLLGLTVNQGECVQILESNQNRQSWMNAQKSCVNKGGNLLVMDEEAVQSVHRCNMSSSETMWEGRYNTFSPWVFIVGCSAYQSAFVQNTFTLNDNGAIQCGEKCRGSTFYALKGAACYCLVPAFGFNSAGDNQCSLECSGRGEPCGGPNAMSVYTAADLCRKLYTLTLNMAAEGKQLFGNTVNGKPSTVPDGQVKPREDDIEPFNILCGLAECNPSTGWSFYGYPCDRSLASICNDESIISDNLNWADAKEKCWQSYNSTLMGNHLVTSLSCDANSTYLNKPLWIQMIRDKVTREVDGTEVEPESTCFGGVITGSNFSAVDTSCNSSYVSVCIIDTNNPACDACPFLESDVIGPCTTINTETSTELETTTPQETSTVPETSPQTSTEQTSSTSTPMPSTGQQTEDSPNAAVIVAGCVGGLIVFTIIFGSLGICRKRREKRKEMERNRIKTEENMQYPGKGYSNAGFVTENISKTNDSYSVRPDDDTKDKEQATITTVENGPEHRHSTNDITPYDNHVVLNESDKERNPEPTESLPNGSTIQENLDKSETQEENKAEVVPNVNEQSNYPVVIDNSDTNPPQENGPSDTGQSPEQKPKNVSVINVGKFFEPDVNKIEEVTQL